MKKRIMLIAWMGEPLAVLTESVRALAHGKSVGVPDDEVVLATWSGRRVDEILFLARRLITGGTPFYRRNSRAESSRRYSLRGVTYVNCLTGKKCRNELF